MNIFKDDGIQIQEPVIVCDDIENVEARTNAIAIVTKRDTEVIITLQELKEAVAWLDDFGI